MGRRERKRMRERERAAALDNHSLTNHSSITLPLRLLASKNLPAAIEDTSGNELPESIREKAEGLQGQGGIAALETKIYSLPELLQRNREIIEEVGGRGHGGRVLWFTTAYNVHVRVHVYTI